MSPTKTLVAGIGNIFNGDDGFGVEVAQRLVRRPDPPPDGVHIADYGIRGGQLAYQLLEGYDLPDVIDARPRGEPPGTVFAFAPDRDFGHVPTRDSRQRQPRALV